MQQESGQALKRSNRSIFDFVIIGAGIIGLTTAWELTRKFPSATIAILEKEETAGLHASGRNSGVLHSGIYYKSSTLKAKICAAGNAKMREFAAEHNIALNKFGKLIVAANEEDVRAIGQLMKNANESKISAVQLDESQAKKIEPYASPYKSAIFCADTAVIDSKGVVAKLCDLLRDRGVELLFKTPVLNVVPGKKEIVTTSGTIEYGYLFNCAGAYADIIAQKFGLAHNYKLVPFKGLYYKLDPQRDYLVKSNIYPVPNINMPFLGVHLTRVVNGQVFVGPTAIPALGRENYGILQGIKPLESIVIGGELLKMYLSNQNNFRHLVHTEALKYLKPYFLSAAQKLVSEIKDSDLIPCDKVGIRPQLVNTEKGSLEMDFVIEHTDSSTHVLNAISPAFTSAFPFAEFLVAAAIK